MQQEPDFANEVEEIEPRDPVWLRWSKFLSVIVVLALMLGGLFGISIHVVAWHTQLTSDTYIPIGPRKTRYMEQSANDTRQAFKQRFIVGSTIGGVCGLIYVIRCLIKDEDP